MLSRELQVTLQLAVTEGSRATASDELLTWRYAGFEQAAAEPAMPFFIEWGDAALFPGRIATEHGRGPVEFTELTLTGDSDRIEQWLGPHSLPIAVRPGSPGVERIVLEGPAGRLVIRDL